MNSPTGSPPLNLKKMKTPSPMTETLVTIPLPSSPSSTPLPTTNKKNNKPKPTPRKKNKKKLPLRRVLEWHHTCCRSYYDWEEDEQDLWQQDQDLEPNDGQRYPEWIPPHLRPPIEPKKRKFKEETDQ